jgi:hypothetical protein
MLLTALLAGVAQAAQQPQSAPPQRPDQPPTRTWREPPGPVREGRLGVPLAGNLHVGVGRFSGPDATRPRTHTEPIGRTADIARRDRGMAAIGLSLRF